MCITFPALYSLANSKGAKVAEVWDSLGEGGGWNPRFGRGFNNWELDMVQDFIATILNKKIAPAVEERLVWKRSTNGTFTIKSCFDLLEGESCFSAPSKLFWNSSVPSKVRFFAWEVWWDKVLTMNQLKRRGFPLASRCPLCGESEEDLHHLLIHCSKVWELWSSLISCADIAWVCPYLAIDLLTGWKATLVKKPDRKI